MIQKLNKAMKNIGDRYYAINCGGCAIFASHLSKRMKKYLNVKTKIVVEGYDNMSIDEIRQLASSTLPSMLDFNSNGFNFTHVVVEFMYRRKTYVIDSDGCRLASSFWKHREKTIGVLSQREADHIAKDTYGWNSTYDRKYNKGIKRMITNAITNI